MKNKIFGFAVISVLALSMVHCKGEKTGQLTPHELEGKTLWEDVSLSAEGNTSCVTCHENGALLNLEKKPGPFPHFVAMPDKEVTLKEMINYCMITPMKSKAFPEDSEQLSRMADYYPVMAKKWEKNKPAPGAENPCNPCNPCAAK
ncbi:MAG: hypothetical protein ABUK01_04740 [Leptospirales bacterium]